MVFGYFADKDPYNLKGLRKVKNCNISRHDYNCGGYALGILSWYCPYHTEKERVMFDYCSDNDYTIEQKLDICVKTLLKDFPNLSIITKDKVKKIKDKEVIAFKVGRRDFHFMVKKGNNHWFEKQGQSHIHSVKESYVFADRWDKTFFNYISETIFFVNNATNLKKSA